MTDTPIDADAFNAFEAMGWEARAAGYDDFFGRITPRLVEPLLDAAGVRRGTRLLDVATGPGYVAARAAERGAAVVGIDLSDSMLALARRLHPDLELRRGDAEALPLPDGEFDAVVGNLVLLHLGRPERAAAEFARVLAPGGSVALTVWDLPEHARFLGVFLDAIAEVGAVPPADLPVGPPFFRFADEAAFVGVLEEQGLEDARVETIAFSLTVASADDYWHSFLAGAVRISALILGQPPAVQQQIRAAFDRLAEGHRGPAGIELPVSARLASARRPRD